MLTTPCRRSLLRGGRCCRRDLLAAALLVAVGTAAAQEAAPRAAGAASAPAPAASASAPQLPRVTVTGQRPGDVEERRQSTAAKIVVGREEIERFGDSTLGDVLKRLPGVTMGGRPGRGGEIRMRGLGSGYTQILLDGQRVPPGFSLDSLAPEQVERIEILRAPTAETGARAIAGTINIITREGFRKHLNDVRVAAAVENGRLQPSLTWSRNEPVGPFIVNYTLTAQRSDRESGSTTTTLDRRLSDGATVLEQRDEGRVRDRRQSVHAIGRLQWRGEGGGDTLLLMPLLIHGTGTTDRQGTLTQTVGAVPASYDMARTLGDGSYTLLRLNGQWNRRLEGSGGRVESKFGFGQSRTAGSGVREETTGGVLTRTLTDSSVTRDRNALVGTKLVQTLAGEHSLVAGAEAEANRRAEQRETNDPTLLANFGDNVSAATTRFAAYVQDEWTVTPQWAAHAGLRWEGIATRGASGELGGATRSNRSGVWTPLLHAVWKPEPESRDQVRLSLTRSYRSPTLQNLIGRPSINNRYPVSVENTPTQADRAGNPGLRPELATGVDVAVERYLSGSGVLSANVFHRQIRDYIRNVTARETVSWSEKERFVSRPQNIGDAVTQGLELEAKFRLSELLADAPKLDLRANASMFRSRVKAVPGPDNRLDQQPGYTANVGADYRVPGWPLTLGGNFNWTPAYNTRISELQTASQGRKVGLDAYGLWVFNPGLQLRLTASNVRPRDYLTGATIADPVGGVRETSATTAPTYVNVQLRLEIKL